MVHNGESLPHIRLYLLIETNFLKITLATLSTEDFTSAATTARLFAES
jgi:hypothetical protein